MLQLADGLRIDQVILAVDAVAVSAANLQFQLRQGARTEAVLVPQDRFLRDHIQAHAFDARDRAQEIIVHQLLV